MKSTRVLIVDDSPTMQRLLANVLAADPEIEVVAQVSDAASARAAIKELNPDVMTLDVEMPHMDGIEFLSRVMRLRPMPVIMVSAHTSKGTDIAMRALQEGAVDCVAKPTAEDPDTLASLPDLIKIAARANIGARQSTRPEAPLRKPEQVDFQPNAKVVAIGSSTGGVEALIHVLTAFPEHCAPTVITQHMPALFTASLAARLDRLCAPKVVEAQDGMTLKTGHVYLAPGGPAHLEIVGRKLYSCRLRHGKAVNGHRPSVDVLFKSVARCSGGQCIGVILTGMGRDGAAGLMEMRASGAPTIGQDEATSVVYGMPKAAFEMGAVGLQLPIQQIGAEISRLTASKVSEGSKI
jgi:two-component system, chemotaxis family, protein-glutamate methylesterase/glutaminase